jgi:hypothetical protein
MASLPTIKRVQRSDLGGDIPEWVDSLLSPLNQFIEEVYSAFNKNLTIPENVKGQIKNLTFRTSSNYTSASKDFTEITYLNTLGRKTQILLLGYVEEIGTPKKKHDAITVSWYDNNDGTVTIHYISGLSNSKNYNITVLGF